MQCEPEEIGAAGIDQRRQQEIQHGVMQRHRHGRRRDHLPVAEGDQQRERREIIHVQVDLHLLAVEHADQDRDQRHQRDAGGDARLLAAAVPSGGGLREAGDRQRGGRRIEDRRAVRPACGQHQYGLQPDRAQNEFECRLPQEGQVEDRVRHLGFRLRVARNRPDRAG